MKIRKRTYEHYSAVRKTNRHRTSSDILCKDEKIKREKGMIWIMRSFFGTLICAHANVISIMGDSIHVLQNTHVQMFNFKA